MYFDSTVPVSFNWHAFEDANDNSSKLNKVVYKKGNSKTMKNNNTVNKKKVIVTKNNVTASHAVTGTSMPHNVEHIWAIVKKSNYSFVDFTKSRDAAREVKKKLLNPKDYTIKKALVTIF